ncbi:hypothetical protein D3C84_646870 [compost metagenome]
MVQGQRCLRIGTCAEHDQSDSIVFTFVDEPVHHFLDRGQAIDFLAVGVGEIGGFHRLGNVDGQHQVPHRLLALDGFFHQHRPTCRHQQQRPDQQIQEQLPAVAAGAGLARCLADGAAHRPEKRYTHGAARFAVVGQVAIAEPRQRQQDQQPGVIKLPHDDAPPRFCRC